MQLPKSLEDNFTLTQTIRAIVAELNQTRDAWQDFLDEALKQDRSLRETLKGDRGPVGPPGKSVKGERGPQGPKGDQGSIGPAGKTASIAEILVALKPHLKDLKGEKGADAIIDDKMVGLIIAAILKDLAEKKKIKINDIFGLNEALSGIKSLAMHGGGQGGGQGSWKQKALTGTIDGVNRTFTFAGEPAAELSERVFLNYIEQNPFTDYTITYKTNTVIYTTAPLIDFASSPHIIRFM